MVFIHVKAEVFSPKIFLGYKNFQRVDFAEEDNLETML